MARPSQGDDVKPTRIKVGWAGSEAKIGEETPRGHGGGIPSFSSYSFTPILMTTNSMSSNFADFFNRFLTHQANYQAASSYPF